MNYKVYQGDELKQTVTSKTAVMNGLQPNKTYEFSVEPDNTQTVGGRTRYTHVAYANMKYVATEHGTFILSERSTVRFGTDNKWVYKTFDAGTYTASIDTFGRDPYVGKGKSAEVVSDFSVGQGSNKTYIGFYTDFIQTDSTNPLGYTWNPNAITSVTTRGIRFNIPKTLTVGSNITLRYEEYPLGIVPIGNEPSGYFGGGNKQNLSATVISTANGSSIVEVAGNVIDVGGKNLYIDTMNLDNKSSWYESGSWTKTADTYNGLAVMKTTEDWNGLSQYIQVKTGDVLTYSVYAKYISGTGTSSIFWPLLNGQTEGSYSTATSNPSANTVTITDSWQRVSGTIVATSDGYLRPRLERGNYNTNVMQIAGIKLEPGTIATPYASFVDGDTFTAQPDGTCALFGEYKALYYY